MGSIVDGHREIGNSGPWTLTCEEVMDIIRRKLAHPDEIIPGQAESLFHIETCENCKRYLRSSQADIEEKR